MIWPANILIVSNFLFLGRRLDGRDAREWQRAFSNDVDITGCETVKDFSKFLVDNVIVNILIVDQQGSDFIHSLFRNSQLFSSQKWLVEEEIVHGILS